MSLPCSQQNHFSACLGPTTWYRSKTSHPTEPKQARGKQSASCCFLVLSQATRNLSLTTTWCKCRSRTALHLVQGYNVAFVICGTTHVSLLVGAAAQNARKSFKLCAFSSPSIVASSQCTGVFMSLQTRTKAKCIHRGAAKSIPILHTNKTNRLTCALRILGVLVFQKQVSNPGFLPTSVTVKLPNAKPVEMETWANQGEPTAEVFCSQ